MQTCHFSGTLVMGLACLASLPRGSATVIWHDTSRAFNELSFDNRHRTRPLSMACMEQK